MEPDHTDAALEEALVTARYMAKHTLLCPIAKDESCFDLRGGPRRYFPLNEDECCECWMRFFEKEGKV